MRRKHAMPFTQSAALSQKQYLGFVPAPIRTDMQAGAFMLPQPPVDVQLVSVGYDRFELQWEPPVFDGGTPVLDYEIWYVVYHRNPLGCTSVATFTAHGVRGNCGIIQRMVLSALLIIVRCDLVRTGSMYLRTRTKTADQARATVKVIELPARSTTVWCVPNPICHTGAVVDGLFAMREYINVGVRARNWMGVSDVSDTIPLVKTAGMCTLDHSC